MDDFHKTPNMNPKLDIPPNNQQHFRLNKISEIKDYFAVEIRERELMSKYRNLLHLVSILLLFTILISH